MKWREFKEGAVSIKDWHPSVSAERLSKLKHKCYLNSLTNYQEASGFKTYHKNTNIIRRDLKSGVGISNFIPIFKKSVKDKLFILNKLCYVLAIVHKNTKNYIHKFQLIRKLYTIIYSKCLEAFLKICLHRQKAIRNCIIYLCLKRKCRARCLF